MHPPPPQLCPLAAPALATPLIMLQRYVHLLVPVAYTTHSPAKPICADSIFLLLPAASGCAGVRLAADVQLALHVAAAAAV
jgi:hypothetical protein